MSTAAANDEIQLKDFSRIEVTEPTLVDSPVQEEPPEPISRWWWVVLILLLFLILSGWALGAAGFGLSIGLPITYKNNLQDQIDTINTDISDIDTQITNIETQITDIDITIEGLTNSTDVLTECITVGDTTVELCKSLVVDGDITTPDTVFTENIVVGTPARRRTVRTAQCPEPTGYTYGSTTYKNARFDNQITTIANLLWVDTVNVSRSLTVSNGTNCFVNVMDTLNSLSGQITNIVLNGTGPTGPTGATGPAGVGFDGAWVNGSYPEGSIVIYNNATWIAVVNGTVGAPSVNNTDWQIIGGPIDAVDVTYTPTTAGDWPVVPTTVQEALDDLASSVAIVTDVSELRILSYTNTTSDWTTLFNITLTNVANLIQGSYFMVTDPSRLIGTPVRIWYLVFGQSTSTNTVTARAAMHDYPADKNIHSPPGGPSPCIGCTAFIVPPPDGFLFYGTINTDGSDNRTTVYYANISVPLVGVFSTNGSIDPLPTGISPADTYYYRGNQITVTGLSKSLDSAQMGYPWTLSFRFISYIVPGNLQTVVGMRAYPGGLRPSLGYVRASAIEAQPNQYLEVNTTSPSAVVNVVWSTFAQNSADTQSLIQRTVGNDPNHPGQKYYDGYCIYRASIYSPTGSLFMTMNINFDTSLATIGVPFYGQCSLSSGSTTYIRTTFSYDSPPPNGFTVGGSISVVVLPSALCVPEWQPTYSSNTYLTYRCTLTSAGNTTLIISQNSGSSLALTPY